jgi:hypothetical protein
VTTTKIDVRTKEQKDAQREALAQQIKEYLANGGTITKCPPNAFTETDIEGKPRRKFSVLITPDSLTDPTKRMIGGFVQHNKKEN